MPRYEVRLEDPNSKEYRITRLDVDDEEAAERYCKRKEFEMCAWELTPEELERIEEIEADPEQTLSGQDKGQLYTHRQETPYEVVSVQEVEVR
jgi:hypothetical protein